jgi:hypothetical protein
MNEQAVRWGKRCFSRVGFSVSLFSYWDFLKHNWEGSEV